MRFFEILFLKSVFWAYFKFSFQTLETCYSSGAFNLLHLQQLYPAMPCRAMSDAGLERLVCLATMPTHTHSRTHPPQIVAYSNQARVKFLALFTHRVKICFCGFLIKVVDFLTLGVNYDSKVLARN